MSPGKHYSIIEKALAIKWAVDILLYYLSHHRGPITSQMHSNYLLYYLLGSSFQLVTDYALLRWLNSMKDTNPRFMQWSLSLQAYNFRLVHGPGRAHANADILPLGKKGEGHPPEPLLKRKVCDWVSLPFLISTGLTPHYWWRKSCPSNHARHASTAASV